MSVEIVLKGAEDTDEYRDALKLKGIFEKDLGGKQIDGKILIYSNVTLFGQEVKDVDIVVLGSLEDYSLKIKAKAKRPKENFSIDGDYKFRDIKVNNFCFVIETKAHSADGVRLDGTTLKVKYRDKYHDVTNQSEKQKYSLKGFFEDRLGYSPRICNFIWLTNVGSESVKNLLGPYPNAQDKHNYLPNSFSMKWLFQLACVQEIPLVYGQDAENRPASGFFNCFKKGEEFTQSQTDRIFDIFEANRQCMGDLTRKKVEQITRKLLKDQLYAQAIGEKLVIISGRAGTGKTVKLLNIACNLAEGHQSRCLILTYNHALVSDIKRTLALAGIPDGIDSYSVNITTLHKFFYEILCGFEIGTTKTASGKTLIENYLDRYESLLNELYEFIEEGVIEKSDLQDLMKTRHEQIAWDYILIDEAQDWMEIERKLIFFIFGKDKTIIADGMDQMVRSQKQCNWTQGLRKDVDFRATHEKRGLRQKSSLVKFVNETAMKLGANWRLEPKDDLYGGKVVVIVGPYQTLIHQREFGLCKHNGNSAYEMLFLVPPSLVERNGDKRRFLGADEFERLGIPLWDGTDTELRSSYSVDVEKHRLLQYDSCRGLEGWCVVCLQLDEFVKYKRETYEDEETGQLTLESPEERKERFTNLWTLIPLTRAIDTLIITLNDPESDIARVLKEVADANPDIVEWVE